MSQKKKTSTPTPMTLEQLQALWLILDWEGWEDDRELYIDHIRRDADAGKDPTETINGWARGYGSVVILKRWFNSQNIRGFGKFDTSKEDELVKSIKDGTYESDQT